MLIFTKFTVFSHLTLFFQVFTSPKTGISALEQSTTNLWYLIMMGVVFALISALMLIYMLYLLISKKGQGLNDRIESTLKFSLDFAIPSVALFGINTVVSASKSQPQTTRMPVPIILMVSVFCMTVLNFVFHKGKLELAK